MTFRARRRVRSGARAEKSSIGGFHAPWAHPTRLHSMDVSCRPCRPQGSRPGMWSARPSAPAMAHFPTWLPLDRDHQPGVILRLRTAPRRTTRRSLPHPPEVTGRGRGAIQLGRSASDISREECVRYISRASGSPRHEPGAMAAQLDLSQVVPQRSLIFPVDRR